MTAAELKRKQLKDKQEAELKKKIEDSKRNESNKESEPKIKQSEENLLDKMNEESEKNNLKFFSLKKLISKDKYPVFSFTPKTFGEVSSFQVMKDFGNNYIAMSGDIAEIYIYKIIPDRLYKNVQFYKEEAVFRLFLPFNPDDLLRKYHSKLPLICYLQNFDKMTFAAVSSYDDFHFDFFELNDRDFALDKEKNEKFKEEEEKKKKEEEIAKKKKDDEEARKNEHRWEVLRGNI